MTPKAYESLFMPPIRTPTAHEILFSLLDDEIGETKKAPKRLKDRPKGETKNTASAPKRGDKQEEIDDSSVSVGEMIVFPFAFLAKFVRKLIGMKSKES